MRRSVGSQFRDPPETPANHRDTTTDRTSAWTERVRGSNERWNGRRSALVGAGVVGREDVLDEGVVATPVGVGVTVVTVVGSVVLTFGTDAAGAIARQIERDVVEPEVADVLAGGAGESRIEGHVEFVRADLDAGDAVVVAHAELVKAPRSEDLLGFLDAGEPFLGDFETGRDPGRETGHRGFVRDGEVVLVGYLADLGLADGVFEQRGVGVEFVDGTQAWTVARARVGGVGAVTDDVDAQVAGAVEHRAQAHRPAVIAALVAVLDERLAVEFGELDDFVADADLLGDAAGVVEFGRGQGLAFGRAGDGVVAQCVASDGGDDAGVDAAREGDQDAVAGGQVGARGVEFRLDRCAHRPEFGRARQKPVGSGIAPSRSLAAASAGRNGSRDFLTAAGLGGDVKFARLRVEPDDPLSPIHAATTDCEGFDRAALRFGGVTASDPRTYVFSVVGEVPAVGDALAAEPGVEDHEIVVDDGDRGLVYVRAESTEIELGLQAMLTRGSLVTATPVEFLGDGSVVFRVLGEPADLEAGIEAVGAELPVTVERLTDYDRPPERVAAALTDRQEEVVRAALAVGYYDHPRTATQEDVAAAANCAPATAGEHLRKAEAALVRAAFDST